jgi:SAM-dependent methyltransferase
MNTKQDFWNAEWIKYQLFKIEDFNFGEFKIILDKISWGGGIRGKHILDLGCGRGEFSVYLAKRGANVTAIDISSEAIAFTNKLANFNEVKINALMLDAFDIDKLGIPFDIITGKYVLHHLEPFEKFIEVIEKTMAKDGRAIFYENNARNKILIFFRENLVGKLGVPKYGDPDEFPFEPREIEMIKRKFKNVKVSYPKFLFWQMLAPYIFKNNKTAHKIFTALDKFIYKLSIFNKYSYVQIIEFENKV